MAQIATGNRDDALEIVQEAMLKLVQRYAGRDEKAWGPLFHRILQSRIRDWYRRQAVRNRWRHFWHGDESKGDPLESLPPRACDGPVEQLESSRFGVELERALNRLPYRQQQAFLLRTLEGLDVKQTAAAMGCSSGSVKTHYSRAVNSLRSELEGFKA